MTQQSQLPDLDPPRYDRDGYRKFALLGADLLGALRYDADRMADEARHLTSSNADFHLETSHGGQHSHQHRPQHRPQHGVLRLVPSPRGGGPTSSSRGPTRGAHERRPSSVPGAGDLREVSNVIRHSPAAALAAAHPDVLAAARDAVSAPWVDLANSILYYTPPTIDALDSAELPHQHAAALDGDPDHYVSVWIALDRTDSANGCLRVAPGSHRLDFLNAGTRQARQQSVRPNWPAGAIYDIPLDPGDAIVFHPRLLHASGPNHSRQPRRALMLRYRTPAPPAGRAWWRIGRR